MPQMAVRRPFDVLELSHQNRLQPAALLHFVGGETLPPASASGLREVCEWALRDLQAAEPSIQLLPRRRRETVAGSRDIHELAAFEIAADDGVEILACPSPKMRPPTCRYAAMRS